MDYELEREAVDIMEFTGFGLIRKWVHISAKPLYLFNLERVFVLFVCLFLALSACFFIYQTGECLGPARCFTCCGYFYWVN